MARPQARRLALWLAAGLAAAAAAVVGGAFIYIHFIEGKAPAPLTLPAATSSAAPRASNGRSANTGPLSGIWTVRSGSQVGYRVQEVLFGQNHIAVGRTHSISGGLTIKGGDVTAATFTVAMATITSDQSQRDAQFNGRIMDTSAYPTGTLKLIRPITLAPLPAIGVIKVYTATADLTLHGHTRPVTFPLRAERTAGMIEVGGSIPIVFAHWSVPNPSFTGFVTTQNHGELEFLIKLAQT